MDTRKKLIISLAVIGLPLAALAQSYSQAPMVVIGGAEPVAVAPNTPIDANFPAEAVTRVGENTLGQQVDQPVTPASPSSPAQAPSPTQAATPSAPASPTPPASPVNKLWPRDTVPIFVQACAGFHVEYVPACTCTITNLMIEMPHDEFLAKSENNTIEQDPRLIAIRSRCVATPQRKE